MPLADSLLVCRSMQQIAPTDVAPNEALKASVLTSTDWQKGQAGDHSIARLSNSLTVVKSRPRKQQEQNVPMLEGISGTGIS